MVRQTAVQDVNPNSVEEGVPFRYSISSYGADYPVDGLVKRIQAGDIFVPPFQRGFVWKRAQSEKFVESLLLGLPVPGIFLAVEDESRRLLVVDGQQRLMSLGRFYAGRWNDEVFRLRSAQEPFKNKTYDSLEPEDRRRLDDSVIHATVINQDEPSNDQSSIYFVFERLNTGGTVLQPQEIRNSIYRGDFRDLLAELSDDPEWHRLYGPPSSRLKDQELILRFFALRYGGDYSRPMKTFLNKFMGANRNLTGIDADGLRDDFHRTVTAITNSLGSRAFRPKRALNAAVFDAVMVALSERLEEDANVAPEAIRTRYRLLLKDPNFVAAYTRATADEESVATRLTLARKAFAGS